MITYFKKALQNKKMETDCPAYEFVKGMTFMDRAKRMFENVSKKGGNDGPES